MKREIERYTDIMTTDAVEQKQLKVERKKCRSPRCEDRDREGKLREKIQQLLRSQWESRLQVVDGKASSVFPLAG